MTTFQLIGGVIGVHLAILFWTLVISKFISLVTGGGVSLVVKKLAVHSGKHGAASSGVEIMGRREGLIAFLLTLIGLSPTTSLVVDDREAVCTTSGLLGIAHQSVPLDRVAQVTSGSKVAFEYILAAVLMSVLGLAGSFGSLVNGLILNFLAVIVITGVFVAIAIALYYLNKRFYVGVFPQGGWPMLMVFTPNVIEGVELNLTRALEIASIIRKLTLDSRRGPINAVAMANGTSDAKLDNPVSTSDFFSHATYEEDELSGHNTPDGLLRDAQQQIRAGQRQEAIATLRQLVRQFPGTQEAYQATRSLKRAGVSD
jgi:hypothetical protein